MPINVIVPPAVAPPSVSAGGNGGGSTPNLIWEYATKALAQAGRVPANVNMVRLGGYTTAGDGGGGLYKRSATMPAHLGRFQSADGAWWELCEAEPTARMFGATGDGSTDDTTALASLIAYCEANLDFAPVAYLGAGDFIVTGLTLAKASLQGTKAHHSNGASATPADYGTRLIHKLGATTDILTLTAGRGGEFVRDVAIHGKQNQNRKASVAITAVSSRTVFTVATGDVPAAPSDVTSFPFYGLCVFFAGEYRLGTGVVQSVNAETGQITLATGWDNYATRTGQSNLLTTSDRVVFAPRGTFAIGGATLTDVSDSTRTGYVGISVEGDSKSLRGVYVSGCHCGIVNQALLTAMDEVFTDNCAMAGIAQRKLGAGSDATVGRLFLQGFNRVDIGQAANGTALDNTAYQTALCGMWGFPTTSDFGAVTADQHIISFIDHGCYGTSVGYMLADKPLKLAYLNTLGVNLSGRVDSSIYIDTFVARTISPSITIPSPVTYPGGQRAVIALTSTTGRQVVIGKAAVERHDAYTTTAGDFSYFTNITAAGSPTTNQVIVGSISELRGVTADWTGEVSWRAGTAFGADVAPRRNGELVIEATNNTTLTFKLQGSDGVVRTGTLTLS